MDRHTGDGLPPVPGGVGRGEEGGSLQEQGQPASPRPSVTGRGEVPVLWGYLFCVLGGLASTASPLAAALFVGFGMTVASCGRAASSRALGVLAFAIPATVLGLALDASLLASALVACCVSAAVSLAACEGKTSAGTLCALVGMATLVQLGAGALLAASQGMTLASSMSSLTDAYLAQLGTLASGASEQLALVQGILRVVWPVAYVIPSIGYVLLAHVGARLASTRLGERSIELPAFAEFDLPLWVVAAFVGSLVGLAVVLTVGLGTASLAFMVVTNVILAVRFTLAAQGLAVLSWVIREKKPSGLMAALAVIAALYLEVQFIVMSIVGLVDVWRNFRHLERG